MRAHQIMTRDIITVLPDTPVLDAANKKLENHVSGLPVVDLSGRLVGIVLGERFPGGARGSAPSTGGRAGCNTSSARAGWPAISSMSAAARSMTS